VTSYFRSLLILALLLAPWAARPVSAHPISLPSAIVDVHPDHIRVEVEVMLEDLVLFYKIEAGKDFYFPSANLRQAAESHQQFILDGIQLVDDEGQRLKSLHDKLDLTGIPERGVLQSELKARVVRYHLRCALDHPLTLITVAQQLGGATPVLPAQLDLVVLQEGVLIDRSRQIPAARPVSYQIDWKNPPRRTMTLAQYREQRQQQFRQRLGITSYSGLYSFIYITPREVRHEILVPLLTLESWLKVPRADPEFVTVEEQQAVRDRIADYFLDRNPVVINGQTSSARLTRLNFFGLDIRDFALNAPARTVSIYQARVGIILSYRTKTTPRQVDFHWESFNPYATFLQSTLLAFDRPSQEHLFVKDRNQLNWRTGKDVVPDIDIRPITNGISKGRVIRPDAKRASAISTALLRNVYQSFQQTGDAGVYDAMATSVEGPLLRQLFLQTKRSLLVAEQGGAIARVKNVAPAVGKLQQAERGSFQYLATWRVTGMVEHWGHIHERENQYQAVLTIKAADDGWRLSAYQLVDQKSLRSETTIRGYDADQP